MEFMHNVYTTTIFLPTTKTESYNNRPRWLYKGSHLATTHGDEIVVGNYGNTCWWMVIGNYSQMSETRESNVGVEPLTPLYDGFVFVNIVTR